MYPNKGADGPSNCLSVHTWRSEKLTLLAIKNQSWSEAFKAHL